MGLSCRGVFEGLCRPHPSGVLLAASTPFAGRSRRGLLAGLRSRGLRPAHFSEVDAQRLLQAVYTFLFGLAPTPPSGFAAGRGGRRLVESQFSTLLIEILWIGRAVASGGSNKLCRSCAPPRGVAAARCACGAHPSGVLLAAFTLIRPCCSLRPYGSRARRRPMRRGAAGHSSRLVCSEQLPPASSAIEADNKRGNASDSKSRAGGAAPKYLRFGRIGRAAASPPRRPATHRCDPRRLRAEKILRPSGRSGQPVPLGTPTD